MAGVVTFRFNAIPDFARGAEAIELFGGIRLHASKAGGFLGFRSIKVAHDSPEFLIAVPACDVDTAAAAI